MENQRTYSRTHPWITFNLDLRRLDYKLWLMLGAAASKVEHISGVPLMPQIANELHTLYLAKGALATTAIEGNTLTESEAIAQIQGNLKLPPSRKYLQDELQNIVDSCDAIQQQIFADGGGKLSINKIKSMNEGVLKNLELPKEVEPGTFRRHEVVVGKYKCAPWQDCEYLMARYCEFLNDFKFPDDDKYVFAIIKAIIAHIYFVWIHPFADGNGRTARLIEYYILMLAGFPSPTCHLLSNHYNLTRNDYYKKLDLSSKEQVGVFGFFNYAVRGLVDGLVEQINYIRGQQLYVFWINYIHEKLRGVSSDAEKRRRSVVLALAARPHEPIKIDEIPKLSTSIGVQYASKTKKTVIRDLNTLQNLDLVKVRDGKVIDRREIVIQYLPARLPVEEKDNLEITFS